MKTLILNQTNVVPGTNNSVLEYSFPGGGIQLKEGQQVALGSITMYNSTPNISSVYVNNSFQYRWIDNALYTVDIETGFYEISDLNNYLHQVQLNNGHYLVENNTGNFVWFLTMAVNASTYKIEVVSYRMTTGLFPIGTAAGQYQYPGPTTTPPTTPGAGWSNPGTNAYPQLVVLANNFRYVIGFEAGSYPALGIPTVSNITTSSTIIPQVNPLSAYTVKCNLVNNLYSIPNNLIYSFPPANAFGSQFIVAPNQYSFIDVSQGYYNVFRVEFTDQNNRGVVILDPNITVLIIIKEKEERY
jgi:hypothetical protein